MVAYSFKVRFAEPIIDETKGGTIRAERRRHARPGEELQLYTGMRTKQCRLIARKTCLAADPIELDLAWSRVSLPGFRFTGATRLDAFARFDGFADWFELFRFWKEAHDAVATFAGVHVRWLPLPPLLEAA